MKQLFMNEKATTLFFNDSATFDDIFEWVQVKVMFDSSNLFNLNEQHSCSVNDSVTGIVISGDEDWVRISIEKVCAVF